MNKLIKQFLKSEDGVTALEYGLIAGVIALAIAGTIGSLGTQLKTVFEGILSAVSSAA